MVRLLIIFITTLFFYRKTVNYGYIIDDIEVATYEKTGKFWKDLWYQIRGHSYFDRKREHTITLLIHTINCMLIYKALGSNNISFLTALLFSVNPVNNQTTVWLSGKMYGLTTMFILFGLWFKPLFPIMYLWGSFFVLNVVFAPLLFIFLKPHFYVLLLPLAFWIYRKRFIKEPQRRYNQGSPLMRELSFRKIIICIKTFGYYTRLCIFPFKLGMCHKYLHEYGLSHDETEKWFTFDKYFWLGIVTLLGIPIGWLLGNNMFGLFWFVLFMAQYCNLLILNHPICERYVYLANIGLIFMLSKILLSIPYGLYLAVAFYVYYVTKLWLFLPAYNTNYEYFHSNKENFKDVAISYNQEGLEAIRFGQPNYALDTFMQGLFVRPFDFRLNYNSANLMIGMGKYDQARFFIYKAEQSLDKGIDNYKMWKDGIDNMKNHIKGKGINVN